MATAEERWCVVTGGRGFAARHLVEMLLRHEIFHVRIADLAPAIQLEPHEESGVLGVALRSGWVQYVSADLRNKAQVAEACQGAEVVFHMATPNPSINNYQLHYSVNVLGTKNVIDACVELGVKRLIYTSSSSVVFDGVHGFLNGNESMPYPPKHNDSYSGTKAEGEAMVMKSSGSNGLLTCCIRPSAIFGPGDRNTPTLVDAARAGQSQFIIGDGNSLFDFTYVENVAHAHVCAERALASTGKVSEKAAGQAYFITNMEPIKFWEFVSEILEGLGYEGPRIKIPVVVLMPVLHLVELTYKLFSRYGMKAPPFTPSAARHITLSNTYDCSKAKDELGYTPIVPLQEGIRRTIDSFSHLRAKNQPKIAGPKVTGTLLLKDKKQTLTLIFILLTTYYNYVAAGSTIITAVSKLLLVALIFLFIHGILSNKM